MSKLEKEIKAAFEAPKPQKKEEFLSRFEEKQLSLTKFILSQAGYIGKLTWFGFAAILICAALSPVTVNDSALWFVSSLMPILALLLVSESARSERYKMAELEAVTRFSLRSVLMARMVILGGMGLIVLAVCAPAVMFLCDYPAIFSGLFVFTPFFLTSALGLLTVRKIKGQAAIYSVTAEAFFVSILVLLARNCPERYMNPGMIKVFMIVATGSLIITVFEGICRIKGTEEITWSW